jgi:diaminopimelate epimerase
MIRTICHRNIGIGADGILIGPLGSQRCGFGLRIFNSDGSEAEKSGNGLRIFARALWDQGLVSSEPFTVETAGGVVFCAIEPGGKKVTVEMGQVSFHSLDIPVAGPPREVLNEQIQVGNRVLTFCAATVGNPHCVVSSENPSPQEARQIGPVIEVDPRFPKRTNVQLWRVIDRHNIQIEIWERGSGYTLASGSSSCAAAAVALRLGRCDCDITVHMPGGQLQVQLTEDFRAKLIGPVTRVCHGVIANELFGQA